MSGNDQFPGLGEQQNQKEQVPDSWTNEIPKTEVKQKKKLKLPGANMDFIAPTQNFGFQPQQDFGNFGFQPQQQQDFGFQPQQQQDFGNFGFVPGVNNDLLAQFTEPVQVPQEDPIYSYLPNSQYKKFGGDYSSLTVQDQFGNLFEIEPNQYIEDGIIYEIEDQDDGNAYWENQNKTQKKDQTKKKAKKEKQPQPQAPKKIPKRLQNLENKDEKPAAPIKKQEKFTMDQLREKEIKALNGNEDKYIELDTVKQPLNIVFIGHVDAGKSTLSGRILIDTNQIDEKTLKSLQEQAAKNGMEGWFMAYAMDESEDERAKGKTVETGKAFFELSQRRFTLLDAPGHKNYVPNMIAGACQSDIACLIISSKQGEFESGYEKGGQTQEHVQLIRALGVQNLVCVISKMDTNNWSEDRYNQIVNELQPWLKKVCDFANVVFIPINAFDSENVSKRVSSGVCSWYNGPSLFEHLNTVPIPERKLEGPLKIPVLDLQKEEGKYYCYGKLEQGNIFEDMYVTAMPYNKTFQIKEIYDAKDRRLYYAAAGENVKFQVKGIDSEEDLQRGFVICATDDLCGVAYEFLAEVQILEMPEKKQIMSSGYNAILHMHTTVQEVVVSEIQATYDKTLGKMVKSPLLRSGEKGIVKISSEKYICLEKYDTQPFLARFTLRDDNQTIAYGTIKKFKPAKSIKK